jgi:uncharacterized protein YqgC (DUF456 family)
MTTPLLAAFGVDLLVVLAVALLVVGVVGTVVPLLPGAVLSLAGVYVYWYSTGFTEPHVLVVVALTLVGLVTIVVDWVAGAISAKIGGASTLTAVAATVVGLVLMLFVGPLGLLAGVFLTVFAIEFYRRRDGRASGRAAAVTAIGILASNVVQVLLTGSILLVMVAVILL